MWQSPQHNLQWGCLAQTALYRRSCCSSNDVLYFTLNLHDNLFPVQTISAFTFDSNVFFKSIFTDQTSVHPFCPACDRSYVCFLITFKTVVSGKESTACCLMKSCCTLSKSLLMNHCGQPMF